MARPLRRIASALLVLVGAGATAAVSYGAETGGRLSTTAIVGLVRETEVKIAAEVDGRLEAVAVSPGQRVKKGDVIAVLSSPTLDATFEEAKASVAKARADRARVYAGTRKELVDIARRNVEIAESNRNLAKQQFQRVDTLAARNVQSQQNRDETAGALRKAEARLRLQQADYQRSMAGPTAEERASADADLALSEARMALVAAKRAKTTLLAPADGEVRLIVASPGEVIPRGQTVVTLEAAADRWFAFTLREDRLGALRVGAEITLTDAKDRSFKAHVTELRALGEFATWRAARAVGDHDLNSFLLRAEPNEAVVDLDTGMSVWLEPALR